MLLYNLLAILNELIILVIISINMYYRNLSDNTINDMVITMGWVQISLVLLCLVANYVGLVYYVYLKCCKKKNQIHDKVPE